MKKLKNPFAYDLNKNLVYIKNKDYDNKGKYYNCYCPKCGELLVPKMGNYNMWHFSHKNNTVCDGNFESCIHKYAKEILKQNCYIRLPELSIDEYKWMKEFKASNYDLKKLIRKKDLRLDLELSMLGIDKNICNNMNKEYTWIGNELTIQDFKADSVIQVDNRRIAIEIKYSHAVDDEKRIKVMKNNIDMVEIDLSNIVELMDEEFDFKKYLLEYADRKWIYKTEIIEKENEIKNSIELKRKELELDIARERIKEKNDIINGLRKSSVIIQNNNYSITNLPVKGEYLFDLPRDVWQEKLFNTFILSHKKYIYVGKIMSWLEKYSNIKINLAGSYKANIPTVKDCIVDYLFALQYFGILKIYDKYCNDWSKIEIISRDKKTANEKVRLGNYNKMFSKSCTKCGEIFDDNDNLNMFYLKYFKMDKECFEEYINSL